MADLNIDGLLDNFTGKTKVQPEPVPFLQFDKQEEGDEDVEAYAGAMVHQKMQQACQRRHEM